MSRSRALAVGLSSGLIVLSYFINSLASDSAWLKAIQPLSIFYHYGQSQPLITGSMAWGSIALLVMVAVLFFAGAVVAFERRDIAT
jgi:ABC-type transport system involved in multi-copper enzyme maturation permease subunit